MLSREARHVPAEDDEERGRNTSSLDAAVGEFAEALLGADIAEDDTVEELALECFWKCQLCRVKMRVSRHTLLRAGAHPVPHVQNYAGEEAHAELHENSGEQ